MIEVLNASYAIGGVTCALFMLALLFDNDGRKQHWWHYVLSLICGCIWPFVALGASIMLCFTWKRNR